MRAGARAHWSQKSAKSEAVAAFSANLEKSLLPSAAAGWSVCTAAGRAGGGCCGRGDCPLDAPGEREDWEAAGEGAGVGDERRRRR